MSRWFNTAGPCQADIHYMLPPTIRLPNLERLIEQRNYFVIHAPRQTGKTTAMLALAKQLTESGRYTAVMVSAEVGSPFSDRPEKAELAILDAWRSRVQLYLPIQTAFVLTQGQPWLVNALAKEIVEEMVTDTIEERLNTQVTTTNNGRSVTIVRA